MLQNQTFFLSVVAVISLLSSLHVLGANILLRESLVTDGSPPPAAPTLQRPLIQDVSVRQAQLMKRMENVNPNPVQALNPNPVQPHHPGVINPLTDENQGVAGVNLPCGWLDGRENPDGEDGVDSEGFRLGPGRYILHIRWTRSPLVGDCLASSLQLACAFESRLTAQ